MIAHHFCHKYQHWHKDVWFSMVFDIAYLTFNLDMTTSTFAGPCHQAPRTCGRPRGHRQLQRLSHLPVAWPTWTTKTYLSCSWCSKAEHEYYIFVGKDHVLLVQILNISEKDVVLTCLGLVKFKECNVLGWASSICRPRSGSKGKLGEVPTVGTCYYVAIMGCFECDEATKNLESCGCWSYGKFHQISFSDGR